MYTCVGAPTTRRTKELIEIRSLLTFFVQNIINYVNMKGKTEQTVITEGFY